MSYLNSPRLTFAGQFQADPSTVNNTPTNFQIEGFDPANGLWNPNGTGNWRFIGCKVTSVTYKDGTGTTDPAKDPIIGMSIIDTNSRVAGKLVDLDSQQQMVSAIWGLIVRIVKDGQELMKGDYETASFTNIWGRSVDLAGFEAAGASYQSIIKNITWDIEKTDSRYLKELYATSPNQLSVQFNVDRYNGDDTSPQFTLGRITGSIGPSGIDEPKHFVLGRQLFPQTNNINYATAVIDEKLKTVVLDLGNALLVGAGGKVVETRDLVLAINKGTAGAVDFVTIGKINYSDPEWYTNTAGICTFNLSDENLALANKFPLVIINNIKRNQKNVLTAPSKRDIVSAESVEYVCADQFVFRLNPGENCTVDFYATNLGKPLPGKTIVFKPDTNNIPPLQTNPGDPKIGEPTKILTFLPKDSVNTDSVGSASITITATDPGNPRGYIDGQVYGISYNLSDQDFANGNQWNFISLLVFDSVPASYINNPDWEKDIKPIMQRYANLYPLMSKGIFNLACQHVFDDNAEILKFVFSKEKTDPDYMPATRDLSRDKQKMIINYLDAILNSEATKETITFRKS